MSLDPHDHRALDAAFARHVVGAMAINVTDHLMLLEDKDLSGQAYQHWVRIPEYTLDLRLVLPWLRRHTADTNHLGEPDVFRFYSPATATDPWLVYRVWLHHDGEVDEDVAKAPDPAHAAVIVLLRAKGIVVTPTPECG